VQDEHKAMVQALADGNSEELARQIVLHIDGGQTGLHRAWENSAEDMRTYWAERS